MRNLPPTFLVYPESQLPIRVTSSVGRRFGRLVVLEYASSRMYRSGPDHQVNCQCDCGKLKTISIGSLLTKKTTSCGCFQAERIVECLTTHGMGGKKGRPKVYKVWGAIIQRCLNPRCFEYSDYGGRGISVCSGWRSFVNFFMDMGHAPPGLSLDRINNDAHYSCGHCAECEEKGWVMNCRWATQLVQQNNTRKNHFVLVDGIRMTMSQAARHRGWHYNIIPSRLRLGWTEQDAVNTPRRVS